MLNASSGIVLLKTTIFSLLPVELFLLLLVTPGRISLRKVIAGQIILSNIDFTFFCKYPLKI